MNPRPPFALEDILPLLPHRPPFLFVDRVTLIEPGRRIQALCCLRAEQPHFAGHFPGQPIMPGVLVIEALAQASGLLLALSDILRGTPHPPTPPVYYLAATQFKFTSPAVPGEDLTLRVEIETGLGTLCNFHGDATVGERLIATGRLTLAKAG
jgi:3-hydroxyacyl-[acyl-carrier-protein] dehydratase